MGEASDIAFIIVRQLVDSKMNAEDRPHVGSGVQPGLSERSRYGLILLLFMYSVDFWRSFASPLQHDFLSRTGLRGYSRRDECYLLSVVLSCCLFVLSSLGMHFPFAVLIMALGLYRSTDILVALSRIAVMGVFGRVPIHQLERVKIMRNILAIYLNYIELTFWFAASYTALSRIAPMEFTSPLTRSLSLSLSFSTITTVGYGNVAPAGLFATLLCAMESFTAVVILSSVAGSLISLAAAPSDKKGDVPVEETSFIDAPYLTLDNYVWFMQRISVFTGYCFIVYMALSVGL